MINLFPYMDIMTNMISLNWNFHGSNSHNCRKYLNAYYETDFFSRMSLADYDPQVLNENYIEWRYCLFYSIKRHQVSTFLCDRLFHGNIFGAERALRSDSPSLSFW